MPRFFKGNSTDQALSTEELARKTPQYHAIIELIQDLDQKGVTQNFSQNCIAASDIMQAALNSIGIKSRIVEVQLSLFRNVEGASDYYFVGYDNSTFNGQIDTHVVVITETDIPYLIDMSLGNMMPENNQYLILPIFQSEKKNNDVIIDTKVSNISITYTYKKNIRLANLHQKSILDRIFEDAKTQESLKYLKLLCTISICLGSVNFALNVILILLKAIYL